EQKQVETGNQISKFLNPIDITKEELWWSTELSIRIGHFQNFQWRIFNPERISISLQTFNSHCMRCSIPFSHNELKLTRMEVHRQILRIPVQIGSHEELQSLQQPPSNEPGYDLQTPNPL
ncbi:hypothetical protein E1A91_A04G094800v1, partial [Gossypium mustelinum]